MKGELSVLRFDCLQKGLSMDLPVFVYSHTKIPGRYFYIRRSGGMAPKFASEILVEAPNFACKNLTDKYPNFSSEFQI